MTDNFELVESGIRVRNTKGHKINRVSTPRGFTDLMFRNVVAAADTAYRLNGKLPDVNDISTIYRGAKPKVIAAILMTDEFREALSYRGVEWEIDSGLSMEQQMAITKLTDYTDRRSTSVQLKELGIPFARYQAWQKQPLFAQVMNKAVEDNVRNSNSMVLSRLMGNAEASDPRALELMLKITGRWNPDAQSVEDARAVVLAMVEAVMIEVKDPKDREAVLSRMRATAVGYDVLHPVIER